MTTKLIKIDGYWIVVSNEKATNPEEWFYNPYVKLVQIFCNPAECNKLILSQNPEHNIPTITFSDEVSKELGIVDVKKIVQNKVEKIYQKYISKDLLEDYVTLAEMGYNQCLANNVNKKFTKDDMINYSTWLCQWLDYNKHRKVIDGAKPYGSGELITNKQLLTIFKLGLPSSQHPLSNETIQSLTKEEYFCELQWKCSVCGGENFHKMSCKDSRRIENVIIDNNSIKVVKIWK